MQEFSSFSITLRKYEEFNLPSLMAMVGSKVGVFFYFKEIGIAGFTFLNLDSA